VTLLLGLVCPAFCCAGFVAVIAAAASSARDYRNTDYED
jgi:hypothetical protein